MTEGWPTALLSEVLSEDPTYGIVQPGQDDADGVPIIRVKDLRNGMVDTTHPLRVSSPVAARYRRTRLRGGEVVVSLVGTVGESAVVPANLEGWNVARAIAVLRPEAVSPQWLDICLRSADVQRQLTERLNTTVQSTLNLRDLSTIRVPVPSAMQQRAIAEVLGALDDKIAANARMVAVADDLRRLRLRSMLGQGESRPLTDLAEFINGKAFTKDATGTGRVVVRIAELNSGIGGSTVYNDIEVPERYLARPGDLLFAWSGSLTVHRWYRPEAIVNQHIFKVVPKEPWPLWTVDGALREKLNEFRSIAADKATTMGHIQRHHLEERVIVPALDDVLREDAAMTALWERALAAEVENLKLAETRDSLLPLLMSGKARVKDTEKVVEGVV